MTGVPPVGFKDGSRGPFKTDQPSLISRPQPKPDPVSSGRDFAFTANNSC
jgi:hypothetical protein